MTSCSFYDISINQRLSNNPDRHCHNSLFSDPHSYCR